MNSYSDLFATLRRTFAEAESDEARGKVLGILTAVGGMKIIGIPVAIAVMALNEGLDAYLEVMGDEEE